MKVANPNRLILFIILALIIGGLIVGAVASSSTPKKPVVKPTPTPDPHATPIPTPEPALVTITLNSDIGMKYVSITNEGVQPNTHMQCTFADLSKPLRNTFSCKPGDKITLVVVCEAGYTFNTWRFDDGTFHDGKLGKLGFIVERSMTLTALFNYIEGT